MTVEVEVAASDVVVCVNAKGKEARTMSRSRASILKRLYGRIRMV
jgi:hypothetical protein